MAFAMINGKDDNNQRLHHQNTGSFVYACRNLSKIRIANRSASKGPIEIHRAWSKKTMHNLTPPKASRESVTNKKPNIGFSLSTFAYLQPGT